MKKSKTKSTMEPNENYNSVLIEDLLSQFKFVIEAVEGQEKRLTERMDRQFAEHEQHFEDMRTQFKFVFEQIDGLNEKMDRRFDEVDRRFEQVDQRFGRLETIMGAHTLKLVEHEERFNTLGS